MRHIVTICCFCERVRDDSGAEPGKGLWRDFKSYLAASNIKTRDIMFSHAYCPGCLAYYRDFLALPAGAAKGDGTKGGV